MTTLSLPQLKGADVLTHSRMQCFKTCARKHYYRYELGVRPQRTAQPLRMGAAFHLGLDLRSCGAERNHAIARAVADYDQIPLWANTEELQHEWAVERETVAQLLAGYFWYWERDDLPPALSVAETIESEQAFELPIRNPETGAPTPRFRVAGKRDQIVRLGDGRIAVKENKTTGESLEPDGDYWKRLRIDQQISLYMHAARQSHPVETVLYDVTRKPSIAPKQIPELDDQGCKIVVDANGERIFNKNGKPRESASSENGWKLVSRVETPAEFGERLRLDIAERPDFYFARVEIPRLEADLAEFEAELWQQQQMIGDARKRGLWPRNTSACLLMGRCEYLDVCHNGIALEGPLPPGFTRVDDIHPELSTEDA